MTATKRQSTTSDVILFVALELGWTKWTLGFGSELGRRPERRTIAARDIGALLNAIERAKRRLDLPADAAVVTCYEAGRDGFWLHRFLADSGIRNLIVDSSSIEVNRRARRAKSDGLDVEKLLTMLIRHERGESNVWSVVNAPAVEDEDIRHVQRELMALKADRTRHVNRIKGLLAGQGLEVEVDSELPKRLAKLRMWDGAPLPSRLRERLRREHARWKLTQRQIQRVQAERRRLMRDAESPHVERIVRMQELRAIGENAAWLFVCELFGWRRIRNRRELGALTGLTPTPYRSGEDDRDQGISKAGNRRVRAMAIEIAWCWLRFQPDSELSRWYRRRFAEGSKRMRKIGIVALARKLLIALWRYVEHGIVPEGALLKPV
jgi:transposase